MTDKIIYMQDNGVLAFITPTARALAEHTIEEIALKDVPEGKPFKIVPETDIPADRHFRNAWEIDEAELTDGVGANYNTFPEPEEE